jgi:hypothetical protein
MNDAVRAHGTEQRSEEATIHPWRHRQTGAGAAFESRSPLR